MLGIAFVLTATPINANVLVSVLQSPPNPVQIGSEIEYTIQISPDQALNTDVEVVIFDDVESNDGSRVNIRSLRGGASCFEQEGDGLWECNYGDKILTNNVEIESPYFGYEVVKPPITLLATKKVDVFGPQTLYIAVQGNLFACEFNCNFSDSDQKSVEIVPIPLPDLVIDNLSHSPEFPTTNDIILFTATVRNEGNGSSTPSTAALRVGEESRPATFDVPALAPGRSFSFERKEQLKVVQNYQNTAIADFNGQVAESNERNNQAIDDYKVSAAKEPPTADAGDDQTEQDSDSNGFESVTLDGSGSSDPDGAILSYQWFEGEQEIATGERATVPLAVGVHTITLLVTDNDELTDADTVVVEVKKLAAPIAVAGVDQTVRDEDNNGSESVTLNGSGSSDSDGSIQSYQWLENGDVIATGERATAPLAIGVHTITLRVTDNDGLASDDAVLIVVNGAPIANAGEDQIEHDSDNDGSESVTLDGSGSSDPDGTIQSYQWFEGEQEIATGERATVPLVVGVHTITLRVTDNDELTDADTVVVEVERRDAPKAVAGVDQTVRDEDNSGSESVTLDGSGSSDSDGTIQSYQWFEGEQEIATGERATVPLAIGVHSITLWITDNDGLTDNDVVQIVVNGAPVANAGEDQTEEDSDNNGSESVTLDGSGSSDPDGTIQSYQWFEDAQEVASGERATVPLAVGVHTITLRVTDNDGLTDEDTAQVEITGPPNGPELKTIQVVAGPVVGNPGTPIGPFTVRVINANGLPLQNLEVDWSVFPATAGSVVENTTLTNSIGETANSLSIATSGTLKLKVSAEGAQTVEFTLNGLAITPGLDENQVAGAAALDSACPALADIQDQDVALLREAQDLLATCVILSEADAQARANTLDQLVPEQVAAQGTAAIEAATTQVTNINVRLTALRGGAIGVSLGDLSLNVKGYSLPSVLWDPSARNVAQGSAASDDQGPPSKLGVFINGAITLGENDTTDRETGFDFNTTGITAGADYQLSDQLIIGGALGYAVTDAEFDTSSGTLDVESLNLSVYGTYFQSSRAYVDGIISFGSYDYETSRRLSTTSEQSGEGGTKGTEFTFSIGAGYEINRKGFTFGPYGRLNYAQVDIDGYAERASNPGAAGSGRVLALGDQQIDSLSTVAGGLASYVIIGTKGVFIPLVRFAWEHEFSDDSRLIRARFVHDPTATEFVMITEEPDRDFFNLGVGMSAIFAGGKVAFLHYETQLGKADISQYSIKGGFRLEF